MRSYLDSEEFQNAVKNVNADSDFKYHSRFDPVPPEHMSCDSAGDCEEKPRLLMIVGPNGSGKSSIVSGSGICRAYNYNIVNPDNYARGLPEIKDVNERYLFALEKCDEIKARLLGVTHLLAWRQWAQRRKKWIL